MSVKTSANSDRIEDAAELAIAKLIFSVTIVLAAYMSARALDETITKTSLELVLFVPVILITIAIGIWYGCVAALAAAVVLIVQPGVPDIAPAPDVGPALLYLSAALSVGFYRDCVRARKLELDLKSADAASAETGAPEKLALWRRFQSSNHVSMQILGSASTISLVIISAFIGFALGVEADSMLLTFLLLAPVLAGAAVFGTPTALLAGIAATAARDHLWAIHLTDVGLQELLANFLTFAGAGTCVGAFADHARNERKAIQRLFATGKLLSISGAEDEVWRILFQALCQVDRQISVRLIDDLGNVRHEKLLKGVTPIAVPERIGAGATSIGRWRILKLCVDGRDLGLLSWHVSGVSQEERLTIDHMVGSTAELGASAAMRARLSAEKAEIEFVARTEQLRTLLLDAVSHHFRTPLASILGSATNLLGRRQNPEDREFLLIIREQTNRLGRYVENFLGVARLESGSIHIDPQALDLEPFLYDVWESFGESGGSRRFLEVQIEDHPIWADQSSLKQVLGNVLENAIKFSREDSIIFVSGQVVDASMVVQVSNEGPEIPLEDLPKIFNRFYRSREAKVSGMGLGLYICKSLMDLMGGSIQVSNRTDGIKGVTMSVTLPLARQ